MSQRPNKARTIVATTALLGLGFLLTVLKFSPELSSSTDLKFLSTSTLEVCRQIFLVTGSFLLSILAAKYLFNLDHLKWLPACFGLGLALRVLYFLSISFEDTPYDLGGHLEYISHSTHSWALPAARNGWEFYHPPLYYWIVSFVVNLFHFQNIKTINDGEIALLVSLGFSVITLIFIFRSCCSLLSILNSKDFALPLLLFIASFPGLIYPTIRVNNDSLAITLAVVTSYYLIEWWRNTQKRFWTLAILTYCLAILAKLSVLPLFLVFILLPVCREGLNWASKIRLVLWASGLIALCLLSYLNIRADVDQKIDFIANSLGVAHEQKVENSFKNFSTFNIFALIDHPDVDVFNDEYRRWAFWEHEFKSAFFSERKIPQNLQLHAKFLVLFGASLLPLSFWGISLGKKISPVLLISLAGILGVSYFRFKYPNACSQDWRYLAPYSTGLLLILLSGLTGIKNYMLSFYFSALIYITTIFQAAFLMRLCVQ